MACSFPVPVRALAFSAAAALLSGFASAPAQAAAGGPFLAHQALYELKLVKSRGSNAISGARGRILYNFSGSACEGYTSDFRQVSELDSGEGKLTLSDLRSHSWEDAAGKSYRFKIDTRMNDTDAAPVPPPEKDLLILCAGRLATVKGFHIALRAFAALRHPTAKLVILGEGPQRKALLAR